MRVITPTTVKQNSSTSNGGRLSALFIGVVIVALCLIGAFQLMTSHAATSKYAIESGVKDYCIDVLHNQSSNNTPVDLYKCNSTMAQDWTVTISNITHDNNNCLSVQNNAKNPGTKIVLSQCRSLPGQVWLRDQTGFYNPNSGLCLYAPIQNTSTQLEIANCNFDSPTEQWNPLNYSLPTCDYSNKGDNVACNAIKEWVGWQSPQSNHSDLLNSYTDGNGYEQWCADFVSYVYKESGYPFTNGERNGWDEYDANNIQYQGFTYHDASNYTPKPGDVAYFDYQAGHVEIVVVGGKNPTFIYGDSATPDPQTGNGNMEANTIKSDGAQGGVVYYLSPN